MRGRTALGEKKDRGREKGKGLQERESIGFHSPSVITPQRFYLCNCPLFQNSCKILGVNTALTEGKERKGKENTKEELQTKGGSKRALIFL